MSEPAPPIQRYLTTAGAMAVLLVMAAITWYSNSAANAALEQVVLRNVKPLLALQSIDRQVKEVRFRVAGVVLDQMPAPGSRQHLGEAGTAIPAAWADYLAATGTADADEQALVGRVALGLAELARIFAKLDSAYRADDDKKALTAILEDDWPSVTTNVIKPMDKLIARREADMAAAYRANRTLGLRLDAAAVAMTLLLSLFALRTLMQHRRQQALLHRIGKLQRSHQSILDSLGEGVYGVDVGGRITFANPALERMLGWHSAELIGRPSHATLHHSRADGSPYAPEACPLHQALRSGQMRSAADEVFWHKDGAAIPVEYTTNPILETGQIVGAVVVFKDITQRRQAEQELVRSYDALKCANRELEQTHVQLLHAEKMASIGQLAAGIAHEINNPIGFVNSNLGSLERYVAQLLALVAAYEQAEPLLPAESPAACAIAAARERADLEFLREDVAALLRDSRDGVGRVKRIVDDLKDFSQVDRLDWQEADLHRGLDSTLNVVWHEIKSKADVVKQYGRLPPVECMVSQLNQVFMNLLVNAAQAIDGHGTITLRSGVDAPPAQTVWIEIADSGRGIAPDILARIFEPFFTTRPVGQGSGLGLAISYGIVKKHGGTIAVTSTPGQGSSFRITLPQRRAATA